MSTALPPSYANGQTNGEPVTTQRDSDRPSWGRRLLFGGGDQPRWVRLALVFLLAGTALLYFWDLTASGDANSFYAAAVQAGTKSWKAWLFGSLDSSNAITVDKPPASLWLMGLSARILGFNSFSLLAPDVLAGVASVWLTYATVRRWSGPAAGLLAGATLALTPVAVLMFKYDNPDALLVLLLCAAAYATVRATEKANPWWLMLAGVALGFGFLTKMMQAFLVLPALALVYLVAAPTGPGRRLLHLLYGGLALLVSAGWYVALVELWPASSRPYIGGSTDNSLLQLAFGYNGLSRLFGNGGMGGFGGGRPPSGFEPPGGGGFGRGGFGGAAGLSRLFGDFFGGQVTWLLPAALIGLVAGLWFTRRAARTDHTRAALLLWGGWLIVTALVFCYMSGIVHPYYSVALAPAIAALVGIAASEAWRGRSNIAFRLTLALMIAAAGVWAFILLERTPTWLPAVRYLALVVSVFAAAAIAIGSRLPAKAAIVAVIAAVLGAGLGTTAYALDTTAHANNGPIPTAGPQGSNTAGFGGFTRNRGGSRPAPAGGFPPGGPPAGGFPRGGGQMPGGAGFGGESLSPNSALATMLAVSKTRWAAATVSSTPAAALELGSGGAPVMAIGGFGGSDPYPSLSQFTAYVNAGDIHYFITAGGPGGGMPGPRGAGPDTNAGSQITSWVAAHYTSSTVDGYTVYDLTRPTGK